MIDRFDEAFDPPAQPARQYEVAPVGEHVVEIIKAERRRLPYRDVDAMSLRLRVGSYSFVFVDLPDDMPWLRRHLAQAVGIEPDLCMYPEELVGRTVRVLLAHVQTRAGGTKAVVKRWVPQPPAGRPQRATQRQDAPTATLLDAIDDWRRQPPPQRPAAGRSRNAVKRYTQGDEDIPF
jgi:hypothetical protein